MEWIEIIYFEPFDPSWVERFADKALYNTVAVE